MRIQIDPHTAERAEERGASEQEILDVVETGFAIPAQRGRTGRAKIFEFANQRHGKYFPQKRIEVFYVVEGDVAITVTVYVFFGKWEN